MSKAAIYCRLSEEDRNKKNEADDSGSIQNQKAMLLEYAAQHSWEVYDIYSDGNYTGSDRNRPAFTRILEDAEVHRFDIILCKSQSRFTRELELVEKYIKVYQWSVSHLGHPFHQSGGQCRYLKQGEQKGPPDQRPCQ